MRHGNKTKKLGRTAEHRDAMLSNMAASLIQYKRIETTIQKAKALRRYIEPLITKAKANTTHSRRVVFSHLQSKEAIKELYGAVAAAVGDRPGGYVRIIRTGIRHGDAAEMALIELVDFNPDYNGQSKEGDAAKGKKRRTRRGGGAAKAAATIAAPATVATVQEEVAVVEEEVNDVVEAANDVVEETNDATEEKNEG